jgi:hypothetical protein
MNVRGVLVVVFAALLAALVWQLWPDHEPKLSRPDADRPAAAVPAARPAVPAAPVSPTPPEPRSTLADRLNAPATDIRSDLRVVSEIFAAYRTNFHENPVGTNAEITALLTGKNPLLLALVPPDLPAINPRGELCDRWGQPFFFHQLSGTQMEIRSAGPDRVMWTDDDVVLTP